MTHNWAWPGTRDRFRNFGTTLITCERIELSTSKIGIWPRLTTASAQCLHLSERFFYLIEFSSISLHLTAIFSRWTWILSSFIRAKDNDSGGDNWSCKTCKASSQNVTTNKLFTCWMPFLMPNQQCQSTEISSMHMAHIWYLDCHYYSQWRSVFYSF